MRRLFSCFVAVWLSLSGATAVQAHAEDVRELRYNLPVDISITAGAMGFWLVTELAKGKLAPEECRWCADNALDGGVRDGLRWSNTDAAARMSDVAAFVLAPAFSALSLGLFAQRSGEPRRALVDALVVLEAAALSTALTQIVKLSVGRERPFVHFASTEERADLPRVSDHNLSFYSGHSSWAFSLVVATGVTAHLRNYRKAYLVWAIGMPLAALAGYLRIAADRHYFTDVLVGAALGSAVGGLTPWLLHAPRRDPAWPQVALAGYPAGVSLRWVH